MPVLKQAVIISNNRLTLHLSKHGYTPVPRTSLLWAHTHLPIMLSFVVGNFGVNYTGNGSVYHLIAALRSLYTISANWYGSLFCGLTLAWDYSNRTVDVFMPGYIDKALHKFQHPHPKRKHDAPHAWTHPAYGAKVQYVDNIEDSPALPPNTVRLVQQIVGTLLYYAITVDVTMLVTLGSIAANQSQGNGKTFEETLWLLNYAATHPSMTIHYSASDMILHVHSDASYLSEPKDHSRTGGHYFLRSSSLNTSKPPPSPPPPNGPLFTLSKIMRNVMGSAAEAKIGATYLNGQ